MKHNSSNVLKKEVIPKALAFGIISGTLICTLFLLLFSFILTKAGIVSDTVVNVISFVIDALGAFSAGYTSLIILRQKGLVYGLITGLLLFFFLTIIGFLVSREPFTLFTVLKLFIMIFMGALGGVVSANR